MKRQTGRFTAEFLLLFLAEEDGHGGLLLKKCEKNLPYHRFDSSIIYRSLNSMERDGEVVCYIGEGENGNPLKKYRIAGKGYERLKEFYDIVLLRIENLQFFVASYQRLKGMRT